MTEHAVGAIVDGSDLLDEAAATARATASRGLRGTNLEHAGDHNQRVTLHAIRVNGPVTRTELAELTGLTLPAIANITRRLRNENLILEAGRDHGARGQPATRLKINPDGRYSIGVNVDRDHLTIVLLDFAGRVRARASCEVEFALPSDVRGYFRKVAKPLLKRAGVTPQDLVGIGVAFPDGMDRVRLAGQPETYDEWGRVAPADLVSEPFGLPVIVENDAAAAALGELHFGAGQRYHSFFYVLMTAGLGGSLVIEGHHFRGANGRSGEIGWLTAAGGGKRARQLQDYASISGLRNMLARRGIGFGAPHEIEELAGTGAAIVERWIEDTAERLLEPLLAVNCLINPEAVLIGGRLPAQVVDRLAAGLNKKLEARRKAFPCIAPVLRAQMSDDAAAVGAGIMPFSESLLPSSVAMLKPQ